MSGPAVVGDYSTWVPPYSYAIMSQLEEKVGFIQSGVCLRNATFQELLVCPEGQTSRSLNDLIERCHYLGAVCPPVRQPTSFICWIWACCIAFTALVLSLCARCDMDADLIDQCSCLQQSAHQHASLSRSSAGCERVALPQLLFGL